MLGAQMKRGGAWLRLFRTRYFISPYAWLATVLPSAAWAAASRAIGTR